MYNEARKACGAYRSAADGLTPAFLPYSVIDHTH